MKTQTKALELSHFPVMLSEITQISSPKNGGLFVDCTFGGGNYSRSFLKYPKTKVIGIDRDIAAIQIAKEFKKKYQNRFEFKNSKFSEIINSCKNVKNIKGIIFDLGYSLNQIKMEPIKSTLLTSNEQDYRAKVQNQLHNYLSIWKHNFSYWQFN